MNNLPKDLVMLLSFVNMQLRDNYSSLTELCKTYMVDESSITDKLTAINYVYNPKTNLCIILKKLYEGYNKCPIYSKHLLQLLHIAFFKYILNIPLKLPNEVNYDFISLATKVPFSQSIRILSPVDTSPASISFSGKCLNALLDIFFKRSCTIHWVKTMVNDIIFSCIR